MIGRKWVHALRLAIEDVRLGRDAASGEEGMLAREVRQALRDIDEFKRAADGPHVEWTPEFLSDVLAHDLPQTEIIVVSNRQPYIHNLTARQRCAADSRQRARRRTRADHARGAAAPGSRTAAARPTVKPWIIGDHIEVPPSSPAYLLAAALVALRGRTGMATTTDLRMKALWPLCHISFVPAELRGGGLEGPYRAVTSASPMTTWPRRPKAGDPIILVHDYHFSPCCRGC